MARLSRMELFSPDEVAIMHVTNRVVRRCFLLGDDPISGKNFDHRKVWIEEELRLQSAHFGIDLLGFAILSNHFHLILRSRPDCVATWDDTEVTRRWLMLSPVRKNAENRAEEPNEMELNSIRNDPDRLKRIRSRLSDILLEKKVGAANSVRHGNCIGLQVWILTRRYTQVASSSHVGVQLQCGEIPFIAFSLKCKTCKSSG